MSQSAEIICIGTELLLGDILNSNAQYLAQQLAELGIPHYYQTVVGDNPTRIQRAIAIACERSRLLIFTGGLGPTPDDLTTETLADFFEEPLTERREIIEDLHEKFTKRGRNMAPSNLKQALLPKTAKVLPNPLGSAPGMIWEPRHGLAILTFPGVPKEMHAMWEATAVPYLKQQGWSQSTIHSKILRHWGIAEATLADKIRPFFDRENPTVAPYAGDGEVRLRISAKAQSEEEAQALIAPIEKELREIIGDDCYGTDKDSLSSVVGKQLSDRNETLAVAESCTAGGLGHLITTTPGSSAYFLGGVISYSNTVKETLLNVRSSDLIQYGAVSHSVAQQMASGVRSQLHSDWGISITGIAGPGGETNDKPIGLVYIGIAGPDRYVDSREYRLSTYRGREWIRWLSACTALDQLRRTLNTKLK